MWPRGGGIWDQDPYLVRDFRLILKFEREWKEAQEKTASAKESLGSASVEGGGSLGMEDALNQYLETLGEEDSF